MLLSEAWQLYAEDKWMLGYSKHTMKAYKVQSNLLIRGIGDQSIEDITYPLLKQYLANQSHLKPASLGHRIRFIKSLFKWAQDEGYITANPAAKLREPKTGTRIPKALTEEDIELLREACITPREHALVEFLYTTGCRVGELAGIEGSVYPHKLRHSYACHLLNNGAPMELIQSLLGHEKMETTRLYTTLSGPRRRELYQRYF